MTNKIQEQDFLLKRIENKATLKCGEALKQYVKKYGDEKGCELYFLLNGDCNEDDLLLSQLTDIAQDAHNIVDSFKQLVSLEKQSALAIARNEDCIEVCGEAITPDSHIKEQDNKYFSITHNKELDCFDMILKKPKFDTSGELLGILSFVHQMGVNCSDKLRIGAQIEQESSVIVNKPKIIV